MAAPVLASIGRPRPHRHEHDHAHPGREADLGASDAGTVVLDIGAGAGAVVLRTPRSMCGLEIEVRRAGEPWTGRHMAVRQRNGPRSVQFAAVFGGLSPDEYQFRVRGDEASKVLTVGLGDGSVAVADWPDPGAAVG